MRGRRFRFEARRPTILRGSEQHNVFRASDGTMHNELSYVPEVVAETLSAHIMVGKVLHDRLRRRLFISSQCSADRLLSI